MILANPWALIFLLPVAWHLWRGTRRQITHRFGSLLPAKKAGRSMRQRLTWIPPVLHAVAMIALVFALTRPQAKVSMLRQEEEGIAIELLLDASSSMDWRMDVKGEVLNRLEAAKRVLRAFVLGDGRSLPGRPRDLIGLVTFARYADTVCPMTLNHQALAAIIDDVQQGTRPNEDGTAFGDAIALAAARLKAFDQTARLGEGAQPSIKSKVMVLLTDGDNNAGEHLPLQAAALARDWGIRVYTVMIGVSLAPIPQTGPGTAPPTSAEQILARIAEMTGGIFRNVADFESLDGVYREIDRLERSRIATARYVDLHELFIWFALPALVGLGLEQLLVLMFLREAP